MQARPQNSTPQSNSNLCASHQDIIDRDMYQLNQVSNSAHYEETNTNSLRDLDEFASIRFCATVDELGAVLDEVPWDVHELLDLVRHD